MSYSRRFRFLGFLSLSMVAAPAHSSDYIAFGDSMTAGFLADFAANPKGRGESIPARYLTGLMMLPFRFMNAYDRFSRLLIPAENRARSWATGYRSQGVQGFHYYLPKKPRKIWNFAVSGAVASGLSTQVARAKSKADLQGADVTILIGANDLCRDDFEYIPTADRWIASVEKAVQQLDEAGANIMISMPPNVTKLKEVMEDEHVYMAGAFWKHRAISCKRSWQVTKFCSVITRQSGNEEKVQQRGEEYWVALQELQHKYPNIKVSDNLWREDFYPDDMSIDCFHAGYRGNRRLASIMGNAFFGGQLRE